MTREIKLEATSEQAARAIPSDMKSPNPKLRNAKATSRAKK